MRRIALVFSFIAFATGCAQNAPAPAPDRAEIRTASDLTDADRRAAPRLELAALYFSSGQYETALDEIKLALAARPDLAPAFNLRGLIYSAMGEERLADESFQRALQINPRDADAMHNRGWFQCQLRRYDDADRLFEQALAQPSYREPARTLLAQGVCQARAGRLETAEQKLSRAFELDAANPTVALNLAEVLYRRREYERARFYVRRVNQSEELSSVASLWLALRIEHRLDNRTGVEALGRQLRNRFPQAPETRSFERGQFDD
ncbi:MAG TPA: type IV pilus biogenesis/stability protein PilW [Burkholderiaceae bacterium]|nr:type IV pilus biogenesis/stability protein PilW [Burkholderiaceae bacterium]